MPDAATITGPTMTGPTISGPRTLPPRMADRLIVALDVATVAEAEALVERLAGTVGFFKIGYWLLLAPGAEAFIDRLVRAGSRVFLDCKMYDIGETVRAGVARAADRGIAMLTVHGDTAIMQAAVAGKGSAALQLLAITLLTSLDDAALAAMGYAATAAELVPLRARLAAECGCDGIIASAADGPDRLRSDAGSERLLVVTPGIRPAGAGHDDHRRQATPGAAIAAGADYLVVGRPIVQAPDPAAAARAIIAAMHQGAERPGCSTSLITDD
jgi:orotidine-5'-phosphate decarboxylase